MEAFNGSFTFDNALFALISGCNGNILHFSSMKNGDLPFLTHLFPYKVKEMPGRRADLLFLNDLFRIFPYLLRPQRVLNLWQNNNMGSKYLFSVDKLMGRDRLNASYIIKLNDNKTLEGINSDFFNFAISSSEYMIDSLGLFRALMKKKLAMGNIFSAHNEEINAIQLQTLYPFDHHIHYRDEAFGFQIIKYKDLFYWAPYQLSGTNTELSHILTNMGFIVDENTRILLDKSINITADLEPVSPILSTLKKMSKAKGLSTNSLKNYIYKNKADECIDGNYNKVFDWCDSFFDEAKQTGITYQKFQNFFFRYGPEIAYMTERAYELMNETRDADIIWEKAEKEMA